MTLKLQFVDENDALWAAARFRALQRGSHWTDIECRQFCAHLANDSNLLEDGTDAPLPGWTVADTETPDTAAQDNPGCPALDLKDLHVTVRQCLKLLLSPQQMDAGRRKELLRRLDALNDSLPD